MYPFNLNARQIAWNRSRCEVAPVHLMFCPYLQPCLSICFFQHCGEVQCRGYACCQGTYVQKFTTVSRNFSLLILLVAVTVLLAVSPAVAFDEARWANQMNLGAFSTAAQRYSEAEVHFSQALREIQGTSFLESEALEFTVRKFGKLSEKQGKTNEAEDYYRKAFDLSTKIYPSTAYPLELIEFYERTGRSSYAAQLRTRYRKPPEDSRLNRYMAIMQPLIKKKWYSPRGHYSSQVSCVWRLRSDGSISLAHIDQSSGDRLIDRSAFDAVKQASPLPPLPSGTQQPVDILFSFDYKSR
jgi:TonB family protein